MDERQKKRKEEEGNKKERKKERKKTRVLEMCSIFVFLCLPTLRKTQSSALYLRVLV
jgi:hypothetical protein